MFVCKFSAGLQFCAPQPARTPSPKRLRITVFFAQNWNSIRNHIAVWEGIQSASTNHLILQQ
ncbi:MAG: hypothetical protein EAY72_12365 [Bacteroidetes bacterium]|nr:MAG: hypothetical protein EAY72_12365 [Bacteroidota bacterium]